MSSIAVAEMNTAEATLEKEPFRFAFVDPISGEEVATMTFYAGDRSSATANAYDHAGSRGWTDITVRPVAERKS